MNLKDYAKGTSAYGALQVFKRRSAWADWAERRFASPSPHFVKQNCLLRNGIRGGTWVETGTFRGETTDVLARLRQPVFSIEPEPTLYANAKDFFARYPHVQILQGTSEEIFPTLLPKLSGPVNFWLDGHYSAGITFKGPQDTPIVDELACISKNLGHFGDVCVQIDDVRCFNPKLPEYSTYPPLDDLVDWARSHDFDWHIEHDIFVARRVG